MPEISETTVCLLMMCKGFQGISLQRSAVATWGFRHREQYV